MALHILLATFVSLIFFVLGSWFWAVAKSPRHLQRLLLDEAELRRFLAFLGHAKFIEEAGAIKPVLGSYAKNIEVFDRAHAISLNKPRNTLLVLATLLLVGSYFINPLYCALGFLFFLVAGLFPLFDSAKNNNMTHVHTIMLNVRKWHTEEPYACAEYCSNARPDLRTIHALVASSHRA